LRDRLILSELNYVGVRNAERKPATAANGEKRSRTSEYEMAAGFAALTLGDDQAGNQESKQDRTLKNRTGHEKGKIITEYGSIQLMFK